MIHPIIYMPRTFPHKNKPHANGSEVLAGPRARTAELYDLPQGELDLLMAETAETAQTSKIAPAAM